MRGSLLRMISGRSSASTSGRPPGGDRGSARTAPMQALLRLPRSTLFSLGCVVLLLAGCTPASPRAETRDAAPQAPINTAPKVLRVAINEEPTQFALGFASVTGTGVSELAWVFSAG